MNPLKKQKTIMKTKNMLWAALSMTAALVMTACSNDDNMVETPAAPQDEVKTIPYTVTVNDGAATTRATVDSDNKTLRFATGDKLYITGTNVKGVLEITSGVGETTGATFSGDLNYTGDAPASDLTLTATLVSAQQTVGTEVSVDAAGAVTVNYPTTSYCGDVAEAVQKYSNLTGTSTYGEKSFTLSQQTAFLNFVITFTDGTTAGTELSAVVKNGATTLCTANVTTVDDGGVKAKFVLPVAKGTTLSSANVKMGDKEAISFGASQTLTGKVYNVKKYAPVTVTWNNNDITGSGNSFTKDGVTITAGYMIDFSDKVFLGGGTFTTTLGNFTKIEVSGVSGQPSGTGWSGGSDYSEIKTWTGNDSSVSFTGDLDGMAMGNTKFVFTIEPTN